MIQQADFPPASEISERVESNEVDYPSDPVDLLLGSRADGCTTGRWLGPTVSGGSIGQQGRADSSAVDA